jgi:hypothetical protein
MERTIGRPVIQCARSTAPHNVPAMCPDRFPILGGYPAHGAVIHLGMIPKRRKHQHFILSTVFRPGIKCACSTAPYNVPAMFPGRFPISGGCPAHGAVIHLGMISKRRKRQHFITSTIFRPGIQCARSAAPQNVPAMCPGRFLISGGYAVPSAVLHLGIILKRTSKSACSHSIVVDAVPWGHVHRRFF